MKCKACGEDIKVDCEWNQGRCPHRRPMIDDILLDAYKSRFYNLFNTIKGWFKNGKN